MSWKALCYCYCCYYYCFIIIVIIIIIIVIVRHSGWSSKHVQQAPMLCTGRPVLSYGNITKPQTPNQLPCDSSTPCQLSFALSKSSLSAGAATLTTQELQRNMQRTHCRDVSAWATCLAMAGCHDEGFVTTTLPMMQSLCSEWHGSMWHSDLKTEAYLDLHMSPPN